MIFRLTATAVREYEVDPKNYPVQGVAAMLKLDRELADDDLDMLLDHPDTKRDVRIEDITPRSPV